MASLQEIKSRIDSIEATKKITKAMKLVASSKIKTAQNQMVKFNSYFLALKEVLNNLMAQVETSQKNKIFPLGAEKNKLHIVITSNLGLCGSYNNNIIKLFNARHSKTDFAFVVGSKGLPIITKHKHNKKVTFFERIGEKPEYDLCLEVGKKAIKLFEERVISEIHVVYTQFVNSIFQRATVEKVLPFDVTKAEEIQLVKNVTDFEPSPMQIIQNIVPLYLNTFVFEKVLEAKVAEFSARRIAMENATDNAQELLENLSTQYNQVRQGSITQEILEVISGANNE